MKFAWWRNGVRFGDLLASLPLFPVSTGSGTPTPGDRYTYFTSARLRSSTLYGNECQILDGIRDECIASRELRD